MDKDTAWSMFESTGNIEAYMLYHDLVGDDVGVMVQEDYSDADKDRRLGHSGSKRR